MLPVINKNLSPPDYNSVSIASLKDEAQRLAAVVDLANSQRREIFGVIERRTAEAAAAERVAGMSDVQKDALRAALDAP